MCVYKKVCVEKDLASQLCKLELATLSLRQHTQKETEKEKEHREEKCVWMKTDDTTTTF